MVLFLFSLSMFLFLSFNHFCLSSYFSFLCNNLQFITFPFQLISLSRPSKQTVSVVRINPTNSSLKVKKEKEKMEVLSCFLIKKEFWLNWLNFYLVHHTHFKSKKKCFTVCVTRLNLYIFTAPKNEMQKNRFEVENGRGGVLSSDVLWFRNVLRDIWSSPYVPTIFLSSQCLLCKRYLMSHVEIYRNCFED